MTSNQIKTTFDLLATVAIVAVAGILAWRLLFPVIPTAAVNETKRKPEQVPAQPISLDQTFSHGSQTAPVTIVEYADFQCPACVAFANGTYKALVAEYVDTGKVRFVFKHFPLEKHAMAKPAAIAAQCAGEQGRFWQYYGAAFRPASTISEQFLGTIASDLKIDRRRWSDCRSAPSTAGLVQAQADEALRLRLRATPAFLVGRLSNSGLFKADAVLYGSRSLADLSEAIAAVVKSAK